MQFKDNHTHLSVWVRNEDGTGYTTLHNLETDAGLAVSRSAAAGILTAFRDAVPLITSPSGLNTGTGVRKTYAFAASHNRLDILRVLPDRFELRYGEGAEERTDYTVLTLMAGFLYGVRFADSNEAIQISAVPAFRPTETYRKERDHYILRTVEYGSIKDDHYFHPDPDYTKARAGQIMHALTGSGERLTTSLPYVVKGLLETLRQEGNALVCSPEAIATWQSSMSWEVASLLEQGANLEPDSITDRLRTVVFSGMRRVVRGELGRDYVIPLTWHRLLGRCAASSVLTVTIPPNGSQRLLMHGLPGLDPMTPSARMSALIWILL